MADGAPQGAEDYQALETKIDDLSKALEKAMTTPAGGGMAGKLFAAPTSEHTKDVQKHAAFAAFFARVAVQGKIAKGEEYIEKAYGADVRDYVKATHALSDYALGGALSLPEFSEQIIEGLEPMTVVRQMSPQVIPVVGSLTVPEEVSDPEPDFAAENAATIPGEFTFGDIKLSPQRLPVSVVVSKTLIKQSQRGGAAVRNLESYITRRLQQRLAVKEDARFLKGDGAESRPLGLFNQVALSNQATESGTTAGDQEQDLRNLPVLLQKAFVPITSGYWVMSPARIAYYSTLRDANGNLIYPTVQGNNTLYTYPIMMTQQVLDAEVFFVDGPSIIIAEDPEPELTVSTEGSYETASGTRSLTSRNEVLIHLERSCDIKLERPTAMSRLTGITGIS